MSGKLRELLPTSNPARRLRAVETEPFEVIVERRFSRRAVLKGFSATAGLATLAGLGAAAGETRAHSSSLDFEELRHGKDENHHVAAGYRAEVLIRWGDPVLPSAPEFDPRAQSAGAQALQFGYNNDFIGYLPLPLGSQSSEHGLLCVNHEFTIARLMFDPQNAPPSREALDIEQSAHGLSVIEIAQSDGRWSVIGGSPYARRITANTPMRLSGPAAGHPRLRTGADPSGREVLGTVANCGGGTTPWGTVLSGEEFFQVYFSGDPRLNSSEAANHSRYNLDGRSAFAWSRYHERFNVEREPNEPNRFGWIVELNPHDPRSAPVKHTALGRFNHEAASVVVNRDGRIVVYCADDGPFEYLYRFVSHARFQPEDQRASSALLEDGTLSVARFSDAGTLTWLPVVYGSGPLSPANGFHSQADVLIETRRAADLVGGTPMDRPEDFEASPVSGRVYVMLTGNLGRTPLQVDGPNPRAFNLHGHILELTPPGGPGREADHAALTFAWEITTLCGNPGNPLHRARYHPELSDDGWFAAPDSCSFDARGRLWVATDAGPGSGFADGAWAMDLDGAGRGLARHFLRCPRGSELCGPCFTPDSRTFFAAIQHPGFEGGSSFSRPSTRWPDFGPDSPPRPSVLVVTRLDGGRIGG